LLTNKRNNAVAKDILAKWWHVQLDRNGSAQHDGPVRHRHIISVRKEQICRGCPNRSDEIKRYHV